MSAWDIIAAGDGSMKILVLNNDVMERSVIQQVLQHNGHEVVQAENSDNALQILREVNSIRDRGTQHN